ncbi:hypothetical protein [Nocardia fluminea]|uniref:hypothetical protein n=1 Tax=Nocardia fluminea TaxID=134984 RepID=UPI00365BA032
MRKRSGHPFDCAEVRMCGIVRAQEPNSMEVVGRLDIVFLAVFVIAVVIVAPVWLVRRARRAPAVGPASLGDHPRSATPLVDGGSNPEAIEEYSKFRARQQQESSQQAAAQRAREEQQLASRQRNTQFLIAVLQSEGIEQYPMYIYAGSRPKKFQRPSGPIYRYLGHGWLVEHHPQHDGDDFYTMLTLDGTTYSTAHGTMTEIVPEREPSADGIDHGRGFRVNPQSLAGYPGDDTAEQLAGIAASAVDLNKEYERWLARE